MQGIRGIAPTRRGPQKTGTGTSKTRSQSPFFEGLSGARRGHAPEDQLDQESRRGLDELLQPGRARREAAQRPGQPPGHQFGDRRRDVAGVLPEQKAEFVRALQAQGRTVAVVGDGINDSLCLRQADVGIAVHGSSDVARETAHIALLEESLWKIPEALDIAREAIDLIRQGWGINFYPNCAAIGLTLLGLTGPIGTTLISNGAALLATLNGLRPLVDSGSEAELAPGNGHRPAVEDPIRPSPMPRARRPA